MIIKRYVSNLLFSIMYVLSENSHAIIIDPFEKYDVAKDLELDMIIVTHEHYDHISGVNGWKKRFHVPLLCSDECATNIEDPKKNMARYFDVFCKIQTYGEQDLDVFIDKNYMCYADFTFKYELSFRWQKNIFNLFSLPGHSSGSIGIIVNQLYFFSGDSLLPDCSTEFRFPGGSEMDWNCISIKKIERIQEEVIVYPGHRDKFLMRDRVRVIL